MPIEIQVGTFGIFFVQLFFSVKCRFLRREKKKGLFRRTYQKAKRVDWSDRKDNSCVRSVEGKFLQHEDECIPTVSTHPFHAFLPSREGRHIRVHVAINLVRSSPFCGFDCFIERQIVMSQASRAKIGPFWERQDAGKRASAMAGQGGVLALRLATRAKHHSHRSPIFPHGIPKSTPCPHSPFCEPSEPCAGLCSSSQSLSPAQTSTGMRKHISQVSTEEKGHLRDAWQRRQTGPDKMRRVTRF